MPSRLDDDTPLCTSFPIFKVNEISCARVAGEGCALMGEMIGGESAVVMKSWTVSF